MDQRHRQIELERNDTGMELDSLTLQFRHPGEGGKRRARRSRRAGYECEISQASCVLHPEFGNAAIFPYQGFEDLIGPLVRFDHTARAGLTSQVADIVMEDCQVETYPRISGLLACQTLPHLESSW